MPKTDWKQEFTGLRPSKISAAKEEY